MDLVRIFDPGSILLEIVSLDRDHAILELLKLLEDRGHIPPRHRDDILLDLLKREASGSTAIGKGIAIPHVRSEHVRELHGAVGISKEGLDFAAPDGERVRGIFLFVSPAWAEREHLRLLAELGRLVLDDGFVEDLFSATMKEDVRRLLAGA